MNNPAAKFLTFEFDSRVYRLSAVKKAAYRFGDRCCANVEVASDNCIRVQIQPRVVSESVSDLEFEFRNEVLDQELREQIAAETERIRNLILAEAFSKVSIINEAGDSADYRTDPLGIASSSQ